jgi:hypothetical protein
MKTFDLTPKEMTAARRFVQVCLHGMGGSRPSDLEQDEYTWVSLEDLLSDFTRHEAAGLMSSLADKGFIFEYDKKTWVVDTDGWRWMDTVWDKPI